MSVVLHLSDPHFGTARPEVAAALLALASELAPDLIVMSGDITQRARRREFIAACEFLEGLPPAPRLLVPGNHDIPLFNPVIRLLAPFEAFEASFDVCPDEIISLPGLLAIGVNSVSRWRHKRGRLSEHDIAAVARRLARAKPGQLRMVVVHHPLDVADEVDRAEIVTGARQAVRAWSLAGADLVLSGHVHRPLCRSLAERYGPMARGCHALVAGTALSTRTRGYPNSVNVIRRGGNPQGCVCVVEQWDFDATAAAFLLARQAEVPVTFVQDSIAAM